MRLVHAPLLAAVGLLGACGSSGPDRDNAAVAGDSQAPAPPSAPVPPLPSNAPPPPAVPLPPAAPDASNAEDANATESNDAAPTPVVDTQAAAAAKLAQRFVDLLNGGQFGEAYMLLGSGAPPRADFDRQFANLSGLHVTTGTPGAPEGAAGSSYLSVPAQLTGKADGKPVKRSLTIVLRRVNDVPGSTQAQRRWHIERVDGG
jgi:hypothetical protein